MLPKNCHNYVNMFSYDFPMSSFWVSTLGFHTLGFAHLWVSANASLRKLPYCCKLPQRKLPQRKLPGVETQCGNPIYSIS